MLKNQQHLGNIWLCLSFPWLGRPAGGKEIPWAPATEESFFWVREGG